MVRINWTINAKKDLKNIKEFIALDSVSYAKLTISKIIETVEILHEQPTIGKKIPEINLDNFREIIYKKYRIMYKIVSENRIDILQVFHSSRDFNLKLE